MKKILAIALVSLFTLGFFVSGRGDGQDSPESEFSKLTIDMRVVVSDIDAAVEFYTEAIGFKASGGFQVTAEFAEYSGLSDNKELDIRVLKLGDGPGATSVKLMEVEGESVKANHDHIESTLGFSYITIFVSDMDAAVQRLKKAGVQPLKNNPATIPDTDPAMSLTLVRDPDGNFVELVGPAPKG